MWVQKQPFTKFVEFQAKKHDDTLIMERPLTLDINDMTIYETTYTPNKEKEFGIGFCLANGLIKRVSDITEIKSEPGTIKLHTLNPSSLNETSPLPSETETTLKLIHVYELTATFQEKAMLFKDTAISESSAIAKGNKFQAFSEDIHQLNAFYKSLGTAILQDAFNPEESYVLTSGKIDVGFMKRIITSGFKIIISRTAPTSLALKLAQDHSVLVIGFARGRKCNVYSFPHRIIR